MSLYGDLIRLCESIESLTGIRVCIYDDTKRLTIDAKTRDQVHFGHYCDFCRAVKNLRRGGLSGRDQCHQCDEIVVRRFAGQTDKPFLHKCHIGLTELVVPIRADGKPIGVAFLGQCSVPSKDDEEEILSNLTKLGGDPVLFRNMYHALPSVTLETLLYAGNLAEFALKHIAETYRNLSPPSSRPTLAKQCENYIRMHYVLPITARSVAEYLHVNPSYLSRIFREDSGIGIVDYIHEQRLLHAKSLLESTELPVSVIAENSGFRDVNYFSRLFRSKTGLSPSDYRKTLKKHQTDLCQTDGESVISKG